MPHSYKKEDLIQHFFDALDMFKECFDTDISEENVRLEFFNPVNGLEVYERFCGAHFPKMLDEHYEVPGYFETFAAQAFVNEKEYGVLIREDIDLPLGELFQIFLHEISHLFCTRNEIGGEIFFDKYCMGGGSEDGFMNAGYAVWREAFADIMADTVMTEYSLFSLIDVREIVERYYKELSASNPNSKKAMSLILAYVMISKEVAGTEHWSTAEKAIRGSIVIDDTLLIAMFKLMFEKLHRPPFWEITPDFILELGEMYLTLLAHKQLRGILD